MSVLTPKDNHVFIATYGSLRKGQSNFRVNANGGGEYIATGKTVYNYNLYRYSGCYFPSVSLEHDSNNKPVVVEIFEAPVEGLEGAYDMLEGYPSFYNRTLVEVILDDSDTTLRAWIYHIDEEQSELVESGDWVEYLTNERWK